MKILTANIAHGLQFGDFSIVGEAALQSLAMKLQADVVCLQEIDYKKQRSSMLDQMDVLKVYGGFHSAHFFPALVGEPGNRQAFRIPSTREISNPPTDSYGIGILSRYPITDIQTIQLSGSQLSLPMPFLIDGKSRWRAIPDEPRIAARVRVDSPIGEVDVVTTHLSFIPTRAISQLIALRQFKQGNPIIFAGDFNLAPSVTKRITRLHHALISSTYPKIKPRAQLDHILLSDEFICLYARTEDLSISDHLAVLAEVAIA